MSWMNESALAKDRSSDYEDVECDVRAQTPLARTVSVASSRSASPEPYHFVHLKPESQFRPYCAPQGRPLNYPYYVEQNLIAPRPQIPPFASLSARPSLINSPVSPKLYDHSRPYYVSEYSRNPHVMPKELPCNPREGDLGFKRAYSMHQRHEQNPMASQQMLMYMQNYPPQRYQTEYIGKPMERQWPCEKPYASPFISQYQPCYSREQTEKYVNHGIPMSESMRPEPFYAEQPKEALFNNADDILDALDMHQKSTRQKAQKIPRPENVFFIYRRKVYAHVVEKNPGKTNPEISKIISDMWRQVPPDEKAIYQDLANKAKAEHCRRYPGYKYKPRRDKKKKKAELQFPIPPSRSFTPSYMIRPLEDPYKHDFRVFGPPQHYSSSYPGNQLSFPPK